MADVEELISRIRSDESVRGFLVLDSTGTPIRSTLDSSLSKTYAGVVQVLTEKARTLIRDIDTSNDLDVLRLKCVKQELLVSWDKEYTLVVIQEAKSH